PRRGGRERCPRRHGRLLGSRGGRGSRGDVRAVLPPRTVGNTHRGGVPGRRACDGRDGDRAEAAPAGPSHGRPRRGVHRAVTVDAPIRRAYLGIGANLGERLAHLQLAVDALAAAEGVRVEAVSPAYQTTPVRR